MQAQRPRSAASPTKGLLRRSAPKVDIGPWPGTNCMSSPSGHSCVVIERISVRMVAAREVGAADRALEQHVADEGHAEVRLAKITWPGVWPGQWRTSKRISPTRDLVAAVQPAVGREAARAGHAEHAALLVELVDPERLVGVWAFDRHASALGHLGHRAAVVDVAVRDQHLLQRGAALVQHLEQAVDLAARVDEGGAIRGRSR